MSQHTIKKTEAFTIHSENGLTQATFIPDKGGAASSIIMPGKSGPRELLYLHDFFWDKTLPDLPGGWPFCFPVCARLERQGKRGVYLFDGKLYELPIHGFSWYLPWEVAQCDDHHIELVLSANQKTYPIYPFEFEVRLAYEITNSSLVCRQTYTNKSDKAMPYYAGFHPYFLTPQPGQGKEKVTLQYQPVRRFRYNASLTDLVGEQSLFHLPASITNPEINEQLTMVEKNKEIQLFYPDGDVIHMIAEGVEDADLFSYIQLYTMEQKPFICVEPWMSFPNAMNSVFGVRWLLPGQSEQGLLKLWLKFEN